MVEKQAVDYALPAHYQDMGLELLPGVPVAANGNSENKRMSAFKNSPEVEESLTQSRSILRSQLEHLSFFNTLTRKEELFRPNVPGQVLLYCCGPTVYHFAHLGNLRTFIFEDILVRTLRFAGNNVRHVMNITDVGHLTGDDDYGEDKMMVAMRREGKTAHQISEFYTEAFFRDFHELNLSDPTVVCCATRHITEMIDLILKLETRGLTYVSNGNVYFDVEKFPDYGKLFQQNNLHSAENAQARVDEDPNKRGSRDFVLWFTNSKFENHEMIWDSPWGRGYPGWHIECSAMALKYLGEKIDIHCGGIDHITVHHTNEIAQSEGATGKHWVNTWLHAGFLIDRDGKMSKSRGDFLALHYIKELGFDALDYKYFTYNAHYSAELKFSIAALESARTSLRKLCDRFSQVVPQAGTESLPPLSAKGVEVVKELGKAFAQNLNVPKGIGILWQAARSEELSASDLQHIGILADDVLGLDIFTRRETGVGDIPSHVLELSKQRNEARKNKNWERADKLRQELEAEGFVVKDQGSESHLTRK